MRFLRGALHRGRHALYLLTGAKRRVLAREGVWGDAVSEGEVPPRRLRVSGAHAVRFLRTSATTRRVTRKVRSLLFKSARLASRKLTRNAVWRVCCARACVFVRVFVFVTAFLFGNFYVMVIIRKKAKNLPFVIMQDTLIPRTIFCHDNLPVLRGINSNSIDFVYLDPPFNKGKTFHTPIGAETERAGFDDIWREESVKDEWHSEIRDGLPDMYQYLEAVGKIGSRSVKYYLIYMAVRLIEIKRILKDTGSVYLHCDPTASHYLKLLLDTIFGYRFFQTEIIWQRKKGTASPKSIGNSHDVLLRYSKTENYFFKQVYRPYSEEYLKTAYNKEDERGRYRTHDLVASPNLGGNTPKYEYKGFVPKTRWLISKNSIQAMEKDGRIVWAKSGIPYRKIYAHEVKGVPLNSTWNDITNVQGKQKIGYPTQKPLALLERIIESSCPKGGLVLDPFCGCATTCIAAERLECHWIGIDVSSKTFELVQMRLKKEVPDDLLRGKPIFRNDIPTRTDVGFKRVITTD